MPDISLLYGYEDAAMRFFFSPAFASCHADDIIEFAEALPRLLIFITCWFADAARAAPRQRVRARRRRRAMRAMLPLRLPYAAFSI